MANKRPVRTKAPSRAEVSVSPSRDRFAKTVSVSKPEELKRSTTTVNYTKPRSTSKPVEVAVKRAAFARPAVVAVPPKRGSGVAGIEVPDGISGPDSFSQEAGVGYERRQYTMKPPAVADQALIESDVR